MSGWTPQMQGTRSTQRAWSAGAKGQQNHCTQSTYGGTPGASMGCTPFVSRPHRGNKGLSHMQLSILTCSRPQYHHSCYSDCSLSYWCRTRADRTLAPAHRTNLR
jgi:hypothetical protein